MSVVCDAVMTVFSFSFVFYRVKLAVCKETGDCVAVKIITVDGKEGLTHESLRKEV